MTILVSIDLLDADGENLGAVSLSRVPIKGETVYCDGVDYKVIKVSHRHYSPLQAMAVLWVEVVNK